MVITSRIPAAMDALEAMLIARNILDSQGNRVPIDVGWPNDGPQREHIWVSGGVRDWEQEQEVTGDMATADREEKFTLEVVILVVQRDTYKAARDRVFLIYGEVEQALRAGFTLSGAAFEAEISKTELSEGVRNEDRHVGLSVDVAVTSYLGG